MEKLVNFLKNEITNEMTLENIIQVFEKCAVYQLKMI